MTSDFFPSSSLTVDVGFGIRDPGWIRNTANKKMNYLDPTARPLRPGGGRPEGEDRVVDEGVVLPGQRQLHLHDVLFDVDRVHCVTLAQP
jgi:hypothetical protein